MADRSEKQNRRRELNKYWVEYMGFYSGFISGLPRITNRWDHSMELSQLCIPLLTGFTVH